MFHLLIGLYKDKSDTRTHEIIDTLSINIKNNMIDKIHVFWEDETSLDYAKQIIPELICDKIVLNWHGKRLLFADLFEYANVNLIDQRIIISNNDIYFGNLDRLQDYDFNNQFLVLTRWDIQSDGSAPVFNDCSYSADAWIFQTPVNLSPQHTLGRMGCDSQLNRLAIEAGLSVSNPSYEILAYHNHTSGVRNWNSADAMPDGVPITPSKLLYTKKMTPTRPHKLAAIRFYNDDNKIIKLSYGISSHSNIYRPFIEIPSELYGLQFTQVFAFRNSSVLFECTMDGLIYIIVESEWNKMSQDLQDIGAQRLDIELETTFSKFAVWKMVMIAGQQATIPLQVILVTDSLEQTCRTDRI